MAKTYVCDIKVLLFSEPCYDLQVDEKESNGKLSFATFDLNLVMNCSALMASPDIEQDNPVTSENGNVFLIKIYLTYPRCINCYNFIF